MERLVALFLDMMAAERGASDNTQAAYRRDLTGLVDFLKRRKMSLETAQAADLQAYMAHLNAQGMAASTAARHLSSIKHFYKFLKQVLDYLCNSYPQRLRILYLHHFEKQLFQL